MTYAGVGVDYDALDSFKRMAQVVARETAHNITRLGFTEAEASRGESAYLIETPNFYLAHVEEGLGTKNLVADAMYRQTGKSYYDNIAQDVVAMIVNDMVTCGALPLSVAMHLAVGNSSWFEDGERSRDLVRGWKNACDLARCVWGGGETPTLKSVVMPYTATLSGSAMGIVKPKSRLIKGNIEHQDAIMFLASSGIHANGLTLAREIARKLPGGYFTKLSDGRTYGETLLDPTHIYVGLVEDLLDNGVEIHYAVNITGHGLRKLMRPNQSFAYIVEHLPPLLPIFDFIQKHGPMDDGEACGNLNMGAGFALYIPQNNIKKFWQVMDAYKYPSGGAMYAGYIERSNEKKVVIKPKGLEYQASTLGVR